MPSSTKSPPRQPVPDEIGRVLDSWLSEHGSGVRAVASNTFNFGSFAIGISMACALVVIVSTVWVAYELKRQNDDIRDLRAWSNVYGQRLQATESKLETKQP